MDHENLDGDWVFLWKGHDQKLQRVTLHMQQDGTRLVVTCRYAAPLKIKLIGSRSATSSNSVTQLCPASA